MGDAGAEGECAAEHGWVWGDDDAAGHAPEFAAGEPEDEDAEK